MTKLQKMEIARFVELEDTDHLNFFLTLRLQVWGRCGHIREGGSIESKSYKINYSFFYLEWHIYMTRAV